jgi:heme oxygenase
LDLASTALVRLNLETRGLREAADSFWRSLCRPDVDELEYKRRLEATYGFEAPFEAVCAYTPGLRDVIDLRSRSRAGLIAQDLLALGLLPSELSAMPHCFPIAPFSDRLEALGWLYVVERATLMHDEVRRHLLAHLPRIERATAYLGAYHNVAGARWQELGHALDAAAHTDDARADLVIGAHTAFRRLLDWYSSQRFVLARGA